jgi:hypothetical protein
MMPPRVPIVGAAALLQLETAKRAGQLQVVIKMQ